MYADTPSGDISGRPTNYLCLKRLWLTHLRLVGWFVLYSFDDNNNDNDYDIGILL